MSTLWKPNTIRFDGKLMSGKCCETYVADDADGCMKEFCIPKSYAEMETGTFFSTVTSITESTSIDNPTEKIEGVHGVIYGVPTISERILTIKGCIVAKDDCGADKGYSLVQNLWKVGNGGCNKGYKIEWEDSCGETYFAYGQVYRNKPVIDVEDNSYIQRRYEVQVALTSPKIFKGGLKTVANLEEGVLGGTCLAVPKETTAVSGGCCDENCEGGNCGSYCAVTNGNNVELETCNMELDTTICVTIRFSGLDDLLLSGADDVPATGVNQYAQSNDVVGSRLVFGNVSKGEFLYFKKSFSFRKGDIIQICSENQTVKLNGSVNDSILDLERSEFPTLSGGVNTLVLADDSNPFVHGKQLEFDVEYYEVL